MNWRVIEEAVTSRTRNAVVHLWARGFESHTLREKFMRWAAALTITIVKRQPFA